MLIIRNKSISSKMVEFTVKLGVNLGIVLQSLSDQIARANPQGENRLPQTGQF